MINIMKGMSAMYLSLQPNQFDFEGLLAISSANLQGLIDHEQLIAVKNGAVCDYYQGERSAAAIIKHLRETGSCMFFLFAIEDGDGAACCADGGRRPALFGTANLAMANAADLGADLDDDINDDDANEEWVDEVCMDPIDPELFELNTLVADLEVVGFMLRIEHDRLLIEPATFFLGMFPELYPAMESLELNDQAPFRTAMEQFIKYFIRAA
jgi:hypothetical protein